VNGAFPPLAPEKNPKEKITRTSAWAVAIILLVAALASRAQDRSGTIRGRVVLKGPAPGNTVIRMGVDPKCSALNAGKRAVQEAVAAKADGSLANVFVKLDGSFPQTPVPSDPVVIDQRACIYGPRVVGARVGQTLRIRNSDALLHNVHSSSAVGNSFNVAQPMAGMTYDFKPAKDEVMLKVGCDIHRWMTAFVGVVSHPYFAVSDAGGSFEIGKVPAGTYTIRAWQERFGEISKTVAVKAGAVATVDFSYSAAATPAKGADQ
jgi:plastocyanin